MTGIEKVTTLTAGVIPEGSALNTNQTRNAALTYFSNRYASRKKYTFSSPDIHTYSPPTFTNPEGLYKAVVEHVVKFTEGVAPAIRYPTNLVAVHHNPVGR